MLMHKYSDNCIIWYVNTVIAMYIHVDQRKTCYTYGQLIKYIVYYQIDFYLI